MEAASSTAIYDSFKPHEQLCNLIAYGSENVKRRSVNLSQSKRNSITTTRLPPISNNRPESVPKLAREKLLQSSYSVNNIKTEEINVNRDTRVKQLEKNLAFVKEHCSNILKCLHLEVEELKEKNRQLQFQLIVGNEGSIVENETRLCDSSDEASIETSVSKEERLERKANQKLEAEIKRLRYALSETLKLNTQLGNELMRLKKALENGVEKSREQSEQTRYSPATQSPNIEEFSATLNEIHDFDSSSPICHTFLPRLTLRQSKQ